MIFLKGLCPHCAEKSGFMLFSCSEYTDPRKPRELEQAQSAEPCFPGPHVVEARFFAAGTCCNCGGPVLCALEIDDRYLKIFREHISDREKRLESQFLPKIARIWPEPEPPYSHPSLPEKVRVHFIALQDMLRQAMPPAIIIAGCRSVLECAVQHLGAEGGTLYARLHNLREKAIVSGVLDDWAHTIRINGNEAIHELEGTPDEAAELVEFTRLFLQYTFEFPARIRAARERKNEPEPADTPDVAPDGTKAVTAAPDAETAPAAAPAAQGAAQAAAPPAAQGAAQAPDRKPTATKRQTGRGGCRATYKIY